MARQAGHRVCVVESDLADREGLRHEVEQAAPDAVVHLAAISFVGQADANAFYAVNVIGTLNLLDALTGLQVTPRRVLLASSANVYGNCDASPISESQAPAPVNHYAMSKLAMEHMACTYADRLPIMITRSFNYTGPGQAGHFLIPKLVSHFAKRAEIIELGNLDVEREFNDVRMVCDAYLGLLEHGEPGQTYNICSGKAYTLRNVIEMLSSITGHKLDVRVNPQFVRTGEVHRLCGSPLKLRDVLTNGGRMQEDPSLEDTLRRMLEIAAVPDVY